jgi:hypothetical protein
MVVLSERTLTILDYLSAIATDIASVAGVPGATVQLALQRAKESYINNATEILISEIESGKIDLLTEKQFCVLVPSAYQFYEAARRGEYAHNLKILAAILSGEVAKEEGDANKVGQMSRRLQNMSIEEMRVLAVCADAFNRARQAPDFDGYHLFIDTRAVTSEFSEEFMAPATKINSHLSELCSRGFLFIGGNPRTIGGTYFYKTEAFDAVVAEAKAALGK